MASLEERNGTFHVVFRFGGKKISRSLDTADQEEADNRRSNLERTIREVTEGRKKVPEAADIATFLLSNGELAQPLRIAAPRSVTLKSLFADFFADLPLNSHEETTLTGMRIHERHLLRILGEKFDVAALTVSDLQRFVKTRQLEHVEASTINKAIVTFRTVWNWGVRTGKLAGRFPPKKDLIFPKEKELPSFMTWEEIERKIKKGGSKDLWDYLFLRPREVEQLLDHVKKTANHSFLYPMFVFAAHTGARRSELLRSELGDFEGGEVLIRERKRVHGVHTTRRVPLSSRLNKALEEWVTVHPGGKFTFCLDHIPRSRIDKAKTARRTSPEPISRTEAHDHFDRVLKDSKWKVLRGWHVFRHSFISTLVADGVDQRVIDDFVGHQTEEQRRRYRHLTPESKKSVIDAVFG